MITTVPWPHKNLSPNARVSRWEKARRIKAYRIGCGWQAKADGLRRIEAKSLDVVITFFPPDNRRRDADNMVASIKGAIDSIADVIGVDDSKWRMSFLVGDPVPGGRVVFEITGIRRKE